MMAPSVAIVMLPPLPVLGGGRNPCLSSSSDGLPTLQRVPISSPPRGTRAGAVVAGVLVVAAIVLVVVAGRGGSGDDLAGVPAQPKPPPTPPGAPSIADVASFDPLAYRPQDEAELMRRGRDGLSHVLYAKSPGGVQATAVRVARWKPLVDRAAARHDVNPRTLQALVFVESAGRPDVAAGDDPESAV